MRMKQQYQRQPQSNAYDIIRRIMAEEVALNWTANQPEQTQSVAQYEEQPLTHSDNPDIQYIGKLVGELKTKLDTIFQLSANTNEWTRDTVSTLIEIDNTLSAKVQSLSYSANMANLQAMQQSNMI